MKKLLIPVALTVIILSLYFYFSNKNLKELETKCKEDLALTAGLCQFHSAATDAEKEQCRREWYSSYGDSKVNTYGGALQQCIKVMGKRVNNYSD